MNRKYLLAIILLAFSIQVVFSQDIVKVNDKTPQKQRGYLVGPRDKIEGKVLGEDQFNFVVTVDENGMFEVPFVDEPIIAKCRTERQIREDVKKHLSKYLKKPLVSVQVTERRKPDPVTVAGEVHNPGQVTLTRETRLLELITYSGGPKESAGGTIRVVRSQPPMCASAKVLADWRIESNNDANAASWMYTLSSIEKGIKKTNPVIYPGDLIWVEKAAPVYINGQINSRTGVYIKEGGLTLTQALAMAGGVREKAKIKDIRIYRKIPGSPEKRAEIVANLKLIKAGMQKDLMLEPYDIIDIAKKKKPIAQIIAEAMIGGARSGASTLISSGTTRILY